MDPALGLKKHLGKWKAFTSITLLKTLLLCGLSRTCSRSQVLGLYFARTWDWVFLGGWRLLWVSHPVWQLFSVNLVRSPHSQGLPQGALRGWEGPARVCASSSHFSFSDNISVASWGNLPVSLAATICLTWLTFLVFIPSVDAFLQHTLLTLILLMPCVLSPACGCSCL